MVKPNRIWFAGSSNFALPSLNALIEAELIQGVLTTQALPQGRSLTLTPSPVALRAKQLGVEVIELGSLKNNDEQDTIRSLNALAIITCSFGRIVPQELLNTPTAGWYNIHASLLPAYRGSAPMQRCIQQGCNITGVTIFKLDAGIDTGPIALKIPVNITGQENYFELESMLANLASTHIIEVAQAIYSNSISLTAQEYISTVVPIAKTIHKEEGLIQWNLPANSIERQLRAFINWPTSYSFLDGKRVQILSGKVHSIKPPEHRNIIGALWENNNKLFVTCGEEVLEVLTIKREGKATVEGIAFFRGIQNNKYSCVFS
ncbi:MAG: methionyl-tRNA formyltransferase [Methylacidiphilales bacterium]|nr:methionyl-tRNA formyltransferase [Candidatus Methylacidiphilales bacterium]